jgi:hypothetical protein
MITNMQRTAGVMNMQRIAAKERARSSESGISLVETLMASVILVIGLLAMAGLIVGSIATNNRNRHDSTQTMLATSIVEQINSTIVGAGTSTMLDCAGTAHTINTLPGGANLSGTDIDFTENIFADTTKAAYHMDYVLRTPCSSTSAAAQRTYDVRWHLEIVGAAAASPTNTYLLTIGSRLKDHGEGNKFFSKPVTMRVMSGN